MYLFRDFLKLISENDGKKDYACVMTYLRGEISNKVIKFSNKIDNKDIYTAEDDNYGREENPHVTVLYGLHDDNPQKIKELMKNIPPFEVKLGFLSIFEGKENNNPYDVLKISVISPILRNLHNLIKKNLENTQTYNSYKPHITIAYMKTGHASKYLNSNFLEGSKFLVDRLVFSSSDSKKTEITLKKE